MTQPARFSRTVRREFAKAPREMEHALAAQRLKQAARRIGERPLLGRREPALADARYRFWSVSGFPYLIVYRPDTSPPSIVRFVHTARDLPPLLADLRDAPDGGEANYAGGPRTRVCAGKHPPLPPVPLCF